MDSGSLIVLTALMRRISKLSRSILAQNSGRDFDRLTLKLARLRLDPFAFFRGANPLFLDFLPRAHPLFRAPCTLICGDLHLENFGAFKGDNRLCYFDINDFDDACRAPFTLDIVRFIAGVYLTAHGLGLPRAQAKSLVQQFVLAYRQSVADGKPRWIERTLAHGVLRALLRRAMRRTRRELLDRFTTLKFGTRRLRIDGKRALSLRACEHRRLRRVLVRLRKRLPAPKPGMRFFRLLDAARRIAGNGSLGLQRDILLVHGPASPDENFVLDLKFAAPSAVAAWFVEPQPDWPDDATRVVCIQRIMQAISPALLHAVNVKKQPFVLKELQPSIDRLDLGRWHTKPHRLAQSVEVMGHVAAWAHLRGCGQHGAASAQALQVYVRAKRWSREADRLAQVAAGRMHRAWQVYCKDYDAGVVTAAVTRS
ncbi:MAG: DUF2252 family protein [Steroidobacteraceae bacterium]